MNTDRGKEESRYNNRGIQSEESREGGRGSLVCPLCMRSLPLQQEVKVAEQEGGQAECQRC